MASRRLWVFHPAVWREWHDAYESAVRSLTLSLEQNASSSNSVGESSGGHAAVQQLSDTSIIARLCQFLASVALAAEPLPPGSSSACAQCVRLQYTLDTRSAVANAVQLVVGLLRFAACQNATGTQAVSGATTKPASKLCSRLLRAVSRSHLLEQLVRAVLLLLSRTAGTRHEAETRDKLTPALQGLLSCVGFLLALCRGASEPRVAHLACKLLSGSCMQHLMLLHVVAQLGAADGGPRYGLPPGAELPVLYLSRQLQHVGSMAEAAGASTRPGPGRTGQQLATEGLLQAVEVWSVCFRTGGAVARPPVPVRALRALCVRLADAAAEATEAARAASGGGGVGSAAAAAARLRLHRDDCVALAQRAMACAIATLGASAGSDGMAGLWRAIVRTVESCVAEGVVWQPEAAAGVLALLKPRLTMLLPVSPLPLHPPPDVTAALSAGYIGQLERVLRVLHSHDDAADATTAAAAAAHLSDFFGGLNRLAGLWAYGEPRCVAALMATGAKMLRRATAGLAGLPPGARVAVLRELLRFAGEGGSAVAGLRGWMQSFSAGLRQGGAASPYMCWWRRFADWESAISSASRNAEGGGSGAAAGAPLSGGSGGRGSGSHSTPAPAESFNGSGDGTGAGSGRGASIAPFARVATLAVFTLSRWLPAMAHAAIACQELAACGDFSAAATPMVAGATPTDTAAAALAAAFFKTVYEWVAILAVAHATAAEVTRTGAAARSFAAPAEAASWRRLLLHEIDVFGLIRSHLALLTRCRRQDAASQAGAMHVMAVLPALAAALPQETRAALTAPLPPPGSVAPPGSQPAGAPALRALEALLGQQGRQACAGPLHLLRNACNGWPLPSMEACGASDTLVAQLLPPPCVVASQLRLRLCGNPECASLAGDSEAALPLTQHGGGCGGAAAAYCSRDCQRAVWRAGRDAGMPRGGRGGVWQ